MIETWKFSAVSESIRATVGLLVNGEWDTLERVTSGRRLKAHEIEAAVREYGRTLTIPPGKEFYDQLEITEVANEEGEVTAISAVAHLWTEEEGMSDLCVELTLTEVSGLGVYETELDGVHVL